MQSQSQLLASLCRLTMLLQPLTEDGACCSTALLPHHCISQFNQLKCTNNTLTYISSMPFWFYHSLEQSFNVRYKGKGFFNGLEAMSNIFSFFLKPSGKLPFSGFLFGKKGWVNGTNPQIDHITQNREISSEYLSQKDCLLKTSSKSYLLHRILYKSLCLHRSKVCRWLFFFS